MQPNGKVKTNGKQNGKQNGASPVAEFLERQQPFDLKAECSLLGSVILMNEAIDETSLILKAEDFYDDANEKIYRQFLKLHDEGKKIDSTLLVDRLKKDGDFEAIGGAAYLSKLINCVPNAAHAAYYAEIIRDAAVLRKIILRSTELLRDAYDRACEPADLVGMAENYFAEIAEQALNLNVEPENFGPVMMRSLAELEKRMSGESSLGVASGIHRFDDIVGLKAGAMTVIAGNSSMGKSACAGGIAVHVAKHSHGAVLFVSLEMTELEMTDRVLAAEARVEYWRMTNGTLSTDDRQRIVEQANALSNIKLFIEDSPGMTVSQIAAQARRIKRKHGLALLVVDYIGLVEPDNPKDNRQEQIAKISRKLKMMARELSVPVICLAQLNRNVENAKDCRPRLSHLRESAAIGQDADNVLFVHRPKYYLREMPSDGSGEEAEILLAKARNAPTREIKMLWFGKWMRWENPASPQHQNFSAPYSDGGF